MIESLDQKSGHQKEKEKKFQDLVKDPYICGHPDKELFFVIV